MGFYELVCIVRQNRRTLLYDFAGAFANTSLLSNSIVHVAKIDAIKDPRLDGCNTRDLLAAFMAKQIAMCYKSYVPELLDAFRDRGLQFIVRLNPAGIAATVHATTAHTQPWTVTCEANGPDSTTVCYGMPTDPVHFFERETWTYLNRICDKVEIAELRPSDPIPSGVGPLVLWAQECTDCGLSTAFYGPTTCPACESDAAAVRLLMELDDQKNAKIRRKEKRNQKRRDDAAVASAIKHDAAMLKALDFSSDSDRSELISLGFVIV